MVKYVKKNLNITKPRCSSKILPIPWPTLKYSSRDIHAVIQPDTNTMATPSHMRHVHKLCVYLASQSEAAILARSLQQCYDWLFSYFWQVHLRGGSAKSLLLSIKSVNIKVSAVWCLTIIGKWKLSTRLIHFLHYRVEDSF